MRNAFSWVLRRSLAGFAAGMAGWWVIPAAGRAAGDGLSQPMHLYLSGMLGGVFIGSVEGMMEESSFKTWRGAIVGGLAGVFGSWLGVLAMGGNTSAGMLAVVVTWGVTGAAIGLNCAWPERKRERLLAGAIAGLLGGALGGWLGYQLYATLSDIVKPDAWMAKRWVEGITGAIVAAVFWCVLGIAEKWLIFRRRPIGKASHKECDACREKNPLNAWYCQACGTILQVAATAEQLALPKRQALGRFVSACQYLARLSATTCFVIALLALFFLGTINPLLGLFGMLTAALTGYFLYILLNSLAEGLSALL